MRTNGFLSKTKKLTRSNTKRQNRASYSKLQKKRVGLFGKNRQINSAKKSVLINTQCRWRCVSTEKKMHTLPQICTQLPYHHIHAHNTTHAPHTNILTNTLLLFFRHLEIKPSYNTDKLCAGWKCVNTLIIP